MAAAPEPGSMSIDSIYIYPIKSLRGISLASSPLTPQGLQHDRRFVLLHSQAATDPPTLTPMAVSSYPSLSLFSTSLLDAHGRATTDTARATTIRVTHTPPSASPQTSALDIPLTPDPATLPRLTVSMHLSATPAFRMPGPLAEWFSARLGGLPVVLAYLPLTADGRRVLGNVAPGAAAWNAARRSLAGKLWRAVGGAGAEDNGFRVGFADCAPLLVVSGASVAEVQRRMEGGGGADVTKFRPNVVVGDGGGGGEKAWEEDFWGELVVGENSDENEVDGNDDEGRGEEGRGGCTLTLTSNCVRCTSLNVDYATGKATGRMLQSLQRDRRVDPGHAWSPVFGRYAFLAGGGGRVVLRVGDGVRVGRRNEARTGLRWPGMGKVDKEDLYPVES